MRIAYFTNQYPKVSHTFIRREIAALEEMGCEVVRFALRSSPEELTDSADLAEVERTRVLLDEGAATLLSSLAKTAIKRPIHFANAARLSAKMSRVSDRNALTHGAYLAEACLLLQWCEDNAIDHIHVHFGTNPTTVALLTRILGGPSYSFTAHGPEEFDKPGLIHLREKIENSAFTVAISHFGKSQLYRQCTHDAWSKIHIVRCGVDESYFSRKLEPVCDTPRLVCVGRISEQKGHLLLIDAATQLHTEGVDFELILVGDGEMRQEVEERIEAADLQGKVKITGWASGDEVQRELLKARALILPSFAEGLPVVIMEALALERPVLSTYVAGIPELVVPGKSGWLVPAGDTRALARQMKDVLNADVQTLRALGADGKLRTLENHNIKKNAKKLLSLFKNYAGAGATIR